jgi:hypothetical protein
MSPVAPTLAEQTPNRTMTIKMVAKKRNIPLKEWLRDLVDEEALSRMWQAIDSRFSRRKSPSRHFLTLVPTIVFAASFGTAAYTSHDPTPLQLADGKAMAGDYHWADGQRSSSVKGCAPR